MPLSLGIEDFSKFLVYKILLCTNAQVFYPIFYIKHVIQKV